MKTFLPPFIGTPAEQTPEHLLEHSLPFHATRLHHYVLITYVLLSLGWQCGAGVCCCWAACSPSQPTSTSSPPSVRPAGDRYWLFPDLLRDSATPFKCSVHVESCSGLVVMVNFSDLFLPGHMTDLLYTEKDLVTSLKDYIKAEESKLERVKQWAYLHACGFYHCAFKYFFRVTSHVFCLW